MGLEGVEVMAVCGCLVDDPLAGGPASATTWSATSAPTTCPASRPRPSRSPCPAPPPFSPRVMRRPGDHIRLMFGGAAGGHVGVTRRGWAMRQPGGPWPRPCRPPPPRCRSSPACPAGGRARRPGPGRAAGRFGAGKTTAVPLALLGSGWLGDRRLSCSNSVTATRAAARRMAALRGEQVGATIGYRTADDRAVGPDTGSRW